MSWQAEGGIALLETSVCLAPVQLSKQMGGIAKHNVSRVVIFMHQPSLTALCKVIFFNHLYEIHAEYLTLKQYCV